MVKKSVAIPTSVALVGLTIAVFLKYRESQYLAMNEATPLWEPVEMDWDLQRLADEGFPMCYRPMIYRNAVKFPNNCAEEDNCEGYIRNRMLEKFGDRDIPLFQSELASGPQEKVLWANLADYMNNPQKYADRKVEGFTRVGNEDEYEEFLGFDNNLQSYKSLKYMGQKGEYGKYTHIGSTWYLIDNTPLHLEWGTSVYAQLSGKKRWLLVHPKYYETCGCNLGGRALHGACYLDSPQLINVTQGEEEISIDTYKDILLNELHIPASHMIDITLSPGDVLVPCDLWLHSTKAIGNSVSLSFRMVQPMASRPYQTSTVKRVFDAVWTSLINKWNHGFFKFHTFMDGYRTDLLENDPRYSNPEMFTCGDR
jgi:hypothetical protein